MVVLATVVVTGSGGGAVVTCTSVSVVVTVAVVGAFSGQTYGGQWDAMNASSFCWKPGSQSEPKSVLGSLRQPTR